MCIVEDQADSRAGSALQCTMFQGSFALHLERYGIDAGILELNCDWIEGLQKVPFGRDWELFGRQLRDGFYAYFDAPR
jgi:hypothetical protein